MSIFFSILFQVLSNVLFYKVGRGSVDICVNVKVTQSCLTPCRSHGLQPTRLPCPWNSPGRNNGVGSLSLLQEIFLNLGWNPGLLHYRWMYSLPSEPRGKPKNTRVGTLPLLQGIFQIQESNWGLLHCRQVLYTNICIMDELNAQQKEWIMNVQGYSYFSCTLLQSS